MLRRPRADLNKWPLRCTVDTYPKLPQQSPVPPGTMSRCIFPCVSLWTKTTTASPGKAGGKGGLDFGTRSPPSSLPLLHVTKIMHCPVPSRHPLGSPVPTPNKIPSRPRRRGPSPSTHTRERTPGPGTQPSLGSPRHKRAEASPSDHVCCGLAPPERAQLLARDALHAASLCVATPGVLALDQITSSSHV
ncbi:hypothetical protein IF1G_00338 [Cordyceps javanica]|uniref:Uncharacterized protein n=1 Tax=Cordyceps javanica TaxID=43265 RepID=A0A545VFA6_9HYPO|nr:hypothetical protein IF1G_00338 [Cordyceps javanica]